MNEKKEIKNKWLSIRLNEAEENKIKKYCSQTTSSTLSEYARSVLLREPVTILFRNASADEFLTEMLLLKKELNAIGNNFNQVVHRLHTLDHIAEIKAWVVLNEKGKMAFMEKMFEIQDKLHQIYCLWLQK